MKSIKNVLLVAVLGLVGASFGENYNFDLLVRINITGTTSNVRDATGLLEMVNGNMAPVSVEANDGSFAYHFTGINSPETNVTSTAVDYSWSGNNLNVGLGSFKIDKYTVTGALVGSKMSDPNNSNTNILLDDPLDAKGTYVYRISSEDAVREIMVGPNFNGVRNIKPAKNWNKKVVVPVKISKSKGETDSLEMKITFTPHYTSNLSGEQVYYFKLPRENGMFIKETELDGLVNERTLKGVYRDVTNLNPISNVKVRLETYDGVNLTAFDSLFTDVDGNYSFLVNLDSLVDKDLFITSEHSDFENSYYIFEAVNFGKQIDKIQLSSYPRRRYYDDDETLDGFNYFVWKFKNVNIDSLNTVLDVPVDSLSLDYVMLPLLANNIYGHPDGSTFNEEDIVQEQYDRGRTDVNNFDVRQAFATQGGYLKKPLHTGIKTKFFFDPAQFTQTEIDYGIEKLTEVTGKLLGKPSHYSELYEVVTENPGDDKCVVVNEGPPEAQYTPANDSFNLRVGNPSFNLLDGGNIFVYLRGPGDDKEINKEYHRQFLGDTNTRSSVMNGIPAEVSLADMAESQVNNNFDKAYWNDNGHKARRYGNPLER